MAYPDAVAIEAAAAKGKTDLSGTRGGARAQGSSSKRIKQSDARPRATLQTRFFIMRQFFIMRSDIIASS
jgi:hypothetical protein